MAMYKFTLTPVMQKQMASEDRITKIQKILADLGAKPGGHTATKGHQPGRPMAGLFNVLANVKAHAASEIERLDQDEQNREAKRKKEMATLGNIFGS